MAAPVLGILGQNAPAAATNSDVYTVPAGRRAVISSLIAAETGGTTQAIRIYARKNGAAAAAGNEVIPDGSLAGNTHQPFTEGWTLAAGDVITSRSASGTVTFTLFGEETDVPTA